MMSNLSIEVMGRQFGCTVMSEYIKEVKGYLNVYAAMLDNTGGDDKLGGHMHLQKTPECWMCMRYAFCLVNGLKFKDFLCDHLKIESEIVYLGKRKAPVVDLSSED